MIFLPVNLRYLREIKGLTQGQLAETLGVKANTISNYETGNSSPDFELLGKLVKTLDTDAHSLLFTDLQTNVAFPFNRVSDVFAPYDAGNAKNSDVDKDTFREICAEYDSQLKHMQDDIESLKKALAGLTEHLRDPELEVSVVSESV